MGVRAAFRAADEGLTWTELGERFLAGAEVREGPAATILRAISALMLLPYAEAVPIIREALDAYDRMDPEELSSTGTAASRGDGAVGRGRAAPLPRAVRRSRAGRRFSTAARQRPVGAVADRGDGRHAPSAIRYMEQVRELRRAIGYDAEHVVNVADLAW